jgi:hypothetical protein
MNIDEIDVIKNTKHTIIALALLVSPSPLATELMTWPNQEKAAISLAYDDALNSQLDWVQPT